MIIKHRYSQGKDEWQVTFHGNGNFRPSKGRFPNAFNRNRPFSGQFILGYACVYGDCANGIGISQDSGGNSQKSGRFSNNKLVEKFPINLDGTVWRKIGSFYVSSLLRYDSFGYNY